MSQISFVFLLSDMRNTLMNRNEKDRNWEDK